MISSYHTFNVGHIYHFFREPFMSFFHSSLRVIHSEFIVKAFLYLDNHKGFPYICHKGFLFRGSPLRCSYKVATKASFTKIATKAFLIQRLPRRLFFNREHLKGLPVWSLPQRLSFTENVTKVFLSKVFHKDFPLQRTPRRISCLQFATDAFLYRERHKGFLVQNLPQRHFFNRGCHKDIFLTKIAIKAFPLQRLPKKHFFNRDYHKDISFIEIVIKAFL